ncbi:hypothetical protein CAPTEDRAFT_78697, partial [Capitella teleta]
DNHGITPLHSALLNAPNTNIIEMVEVLVQKGADVNIRSSGGVAPLHTTHALKNPSIVKVLLEHGADPNAVDNGGNTPLHYAIWKRRKPIEDLL